MQKFIDFVNAFKGVLFLVVLIALSLFIIFKVQSCGPVGNGGGGTIVVVHPGTKQTPTEADKNAVPKGTTITAKTTLETVTKKPGYKKNTSVLVYVDSSCNTCTGITLIDTYSAKFGFYFEPKFYLVRGLDYWSPGLEVGAFRYYRYSLNAMVSCPYLGLGINYDLTNNFSILAGGDIQYVTASDWTDLGGVKFGVEGVSPVLGVAFGF